MTPSPICNDPKDRFAHANQIGDGVKSTALFLIVLGLSSFLFFFRLGDRPLRNPDEGRYAEIAKEMVERGDWVEPRLYGVDYLKKPVLD